MVQRKALGKGLGALIPGMSEGMLEKPEGMLLVDIDEIYPSPLQPRKSFDQGKIEELAQSIRENGIIQPLVVRRKGAHGFELIAGERRWRAAQKAGLNKVPVIIKDADEKGRLELSLIENIQREDLNAIEEAEAYQKLLDLFDYTQDEIGKRVGKSRSTIANSLRLLKLNKKIKDDLMQHKIEMGHARSYLGLESSSQQMGIHSQVLKGNLSVRQTESLVKRMKKGLKAKHPDKQDNQYEFLLSELRKILGTKVSIIQKGNKRGKLVIEFYSIDELERVFELIRGH
ncbi:MAG: ParB/RepB/Spo0J family partition protein [Proteobacteria bacterium]|nr:ParB/RepB/Spo0J family partition protein [Pseudomonadota bacterium]